MKSNLVDAVVDRKIRDIVERHRAGAFDNVAVDRLMNERPMSREQAEWFGRHLLQSSRGIEAYRDGQAILRDLRDSKNAA